MEFKGDAFNVLTVVIHADTPVMTPPRKKKTTEQDVLTCPEGRRSQLKASSSPAAPTPINIFFKMCPKYKSPPCLIAEGKTGNSGSSVKGDKREECTL